MAPGEGAPLPTHDAIEPALARWREAERAIQRQHLSLDWHAVSRLGVGAAVWHLQRSTTMVELVAASVSLAGDPAEWDWVALIGADAGLPLQPETVRDRSRGR